MNIAKNTSVQDPFACTAIAWSPDGTLIAGADNRGTVGLWNAATLARIWAVNDTSVTWVNALAFDPESPLLWVGRKTIVSLELTKGKKTAAAFKGHKAAPRGMSLTDSVLVSGGGSTTESDDCFLRFWGRKDQAEIGKVKMPTYEMKWASGATKSYAAGIGAVAISADGKLCAAGCDDGKIRLFGMADRVAGQEIDFGGSVKDVVFGKGNALFATGATSVAPLAGTIRIYDASGALKQTLAGSGTEGSGYKGEALALSPDGKLLASARTTSDEKKDIDEHRVHIWNTATWKEEQSFTLSSYVHDVAFSPDGERLLMGGTFGLEVGNFA